MSGPAIGFRVKIDPSRWLEKAGQVTARLANLAPAMPACVAELRASPRREFAAKAWFPPSGGAVAWKPTVPFGTTDVVHPPLVRSGAYREAWGGGAGSITRVSPSGAVIGVSGGAFPYAAVLRGGAGSEISLEDTIIRPKRRSAGKRGGTAMKWFLGLTFGVWISEARLAEGLHIPPRPHATDNPFLRFRLKGVLRAYVLDGRTELLAA
jgi:hypothetical protein